MVFNQSGHRDTRAVLQRRILAAAVAAALLVGAMALVVRTEGGYAAASYLWLKLRGGYTVEERIQKHARDVESRLKPRFDAAGIVYPPTQLAYVAFKDTAKLQVYARPDAAAPWKQVHTYPIVRMSGGLGPKLRQGDNQVPEGVYRAEFLNANSRFHLSIRLNYPNEFDRAQARVDGRSRLGSDIMIHGAASSIGCLAMGNRAAEDLFILAALAGKEQVEIVVAPTDFRRKPIEVPAGAPTWLPVLYQTIQSELTRFPEQL
jgi:murein L,D-transpeptidase YafK